MATEVTAARVSCTSGHGTGKSSQIAIVVILFMLMYPDARVVLVANKLDQVKIGVFRNIRKYWRVLCRRHPWIENYFELTEETFYERAAKGIWEMSPKACKVGNEEALAGEHAKHLLWIIDEASGISDKAFGFITGSLTEKDNRLVMLSQPTRDNGYFWASHNDPAIMQDFTQLIFSSEDSTIVTTEFIMEKFRQYGSDRNNPEYMIKVRGLFPSSFSGYLLTADDMLRAARAKPKLGKDWGWCLTADVGDGRDSSVINITKVSGERTERRVKAHSVTEYSGSIDPVDFAREIIAVVKSGEFPNIAVGIDSDGVGSTTARLVEDAGITVQRIRWGYKCFSDQDQKDYVNKRAFATVMTKYAIISGRMSVDRDAKTRMQGSRIPYFLDEMGRYQIEKKKTMREKLNIKSPDRFDTYCFTQLMDITPANSEVNIHTMEERKLSGGWAKEVTQA